MRYSDDREYQPQHTKTRLNTGVPRFRERLQCERSKESQEDIRRARRIGPSAFLREQEK